jgi:Leucine-rich repeat (LRR) protein
MKNTEPYKKAEAKIAAALRDGAIELDLSCKFGADDSEKLTELPESLSQLTQLQSLDLRHNQLSTLPESLGQLTQLQSLKLRNNQLSTLPESLGQLTKLQSLNLERNQLSALPESLSQLTQLRLLNLSYNRLSTLPEWPGQLIQLQELYLDGNQLSTLPESLGQLTQITYLNFNNNRITNVPENVVNLNKLETLAIGGNLISHNDIITISKLTPLKHLALQNQKFDFLPEEIGNLTNLKELSVWDCSLTKLPDTLGKLWKLEKLLLLENQLTDLPRSFSQLEHLEELELKGNPLNPELAAAYEQGLDAVKAYLHAQAEEQIILDEAKLILIGEGGVGKTSMLGALRGDKWVESRKTTHGVEVDIKSLLLTDANSGKTITFNGWDFGGQNIYRHTHQLYFTAPAVYLAVWEPRRGPEQCAVAEWIKMVKHRAYNENRPDERPRVLVVATHGGPKERLDHIDEQALRDEFGHLICGFHHLDSKTGEGLDNLKKAIAREAAAIPSVGRKVPKSWKNMLEALRQRSQTEPYISYNAFEAVCAEQGLEPLLVTIYAAILNELGHIIHYRGDTVLQDTVILKAEWLSKAMSYVLEDKAIKERNGLVAHQRLSEIWDDPAREDRYPENIHPVFLKLMERFDFSYNVAMPEKDAPLTILIAQLVPSGRPDEWEQDWSPQADSNDSERTQVCRIVDAETGRTAEVEGLLYRLIVRLHRYSLGKNDYCQSRHWKTGMILDDGFNGRAFIEEISGDVRVTVRAAYPERFLHLLCEEVRWLVESFWKGLDCRLSVPCHAPCKGLHEMEELIECKREGIEKVRCSVCKKFHIINSLLATVAPKPDWDEALQQVTSNQQQILSAVNDNYTSLSTQLRAVMSQIDEQFAKLMTTLTDLAKDGPRLFSFEALEPGFFDTPDWINKKFRLTLWCEHSRLPLPIVANDKNRGVYELKLTRKWVIKAAPLLKMLSTTLTLALPVVAPAAKLMLDSPDYKAIEDQLKFGHRCSVALLKSGETVGDWLTSDSHTELENTQQQAIRAQGSVLRELHTLLKEKDPSSQFGGLVRVQNKKREFLWVYQKFVNEY